MPGLPAAKYKFTRFFNELANKLNRIQAKKGESKSNPKPVKLRSESFTFSDNKR